MIQILSLSFEVEVSLIRYQFEHEQTKFVSTSRQLFPTVIGISCCGHPALFFFAYNCDFIRLILYIYYVINSLYCHLVYFEGEA